MQRRWNCLPAAALVAAALLGAPWSSVVAAPQLEGAFARVVLPWQGRPHLDGNIVVAADEVTPPGARVPQRPPDPGTSCGPLVTDPGTFCLDMGRQFGPAVQPQPDIRFPNYSEVADQIARSPDAGKRAKATELLNQARDAWTAGFHETALDLLRTAQVALY